MGPELVDKEYKDFAALSCFAEDYLSEMRETGPNKKDSIALSSIAHEIYKNILYDMYEYVQDENMDLRILIGVKSNLIEHIVESGIELELDEFDARVGSLANFLLDNEGPELKRGLFDGLKDIEQLVIAEKDQAVESQEDVPTESILTFLTYRSYDSLLLEDKVSMIKDMYDRFEELSSENPQSIDLNEIDLVMLYLQEYLSL